MLTGAELTIYNENDDAVAISLTPTQLKAVVQILGIRASENPCEFKCFSDDVIRTLFDMRGNPLKLKEEKQ